MVTGLSVYRRSRAYVLVEPRAASSCWDQAWQPLSLWHRSLPLSADLVHFCAAMSLLADKAFTCANRCQGHLLGVMRAWLWDRVALQLKRHYSHLMVELSVID